MEPLIRELDRFGTTSWVISEGGFRYTVTAVGGGLEICSASNRLQITPVGRNAIQVSINGQLVEPEIKPADQSRKIARTS